MIDGHAHIFLRRLVGTAPLRYKPYRDATLPAYLSQLDQFGIRGGVLVQPSFLGCDNGYLLQGLRRGAGRLRGIAVIAPDCPLATMRDMDAAGVVGLRLNLFGRPLPDLRSRAWRRCLARATRLGWQVEVHRPAQDWPLLLPPLLDAGVKVVIDHFGRPHPALGVDDPGFRYLLDAGAASGRIWVKISAAYRNGLAGRGEDIARAALPLLDGALGPERMLWGSDWPHTQFGSIRYARTLELLEQWLPDAGRRRQITHDTPAELFRFDAPAATENGGRPPDGWPDS
ncbi:amidohydrolase [Chromobacterium sp.]|uniref:amidohydrolase family protein n=1 Tax=Chromobacterium sp. TaxID=306190 RepID=UPI0035AFCE10